jgi:hypothetical protein
MTADTIKGLMEEVEHAPIVEVKRDRYGYHVFRDGEEQYLRRVTTLLRGIPKDWLANWTAKMVAEFAIDHKEAWSELPRTDALKLLKGSPWSKRDDAGDRGTAIHAALEAFVRGKPIPTMNDDERACANAATRFLKARASRILGSELTVYNLTHGYAGTFDLWDIHDGASWILDYKSSSSVYAEHAVQQVAYMKAEYAVVQKQSKNEDEWSGKLIPWKGLVDRIGIVHVEPDKATLHPISGAAVPRLWDVFRAAAFVKTWQLDTDDYAGRAPRERIYDEPIIHPVETE